MALNQKAYTSKTRKQKTDTFRQLQLKESSNIHSAYYNEHTGTLKVAFHRGPVYNYEGVDKRAVGNWQRSGSVGQYFNRHFKNNKKYPYTRVR